MGQSLTEIRGWTMRDLKTQHLIATYWKVIENRDRPVPE